MPIFIHDRDDHRAFKMITAQFCANGNTKQAEISRAFGVPAINIKRAVKRYREDGIEGFYGPRKSRGASVLTEAVLIEAQQLFDDGLDLSEVAVRIAVKRDTLSKAVRAGRLHCPGKKNTECAKQKRTQH